MRLQGKVAVITGGGHGLGRALGPGLAAQGAKIVAADIDGPATKEAEQEVNAAGGEALGIPTDVSSEESVKNMVNEAIKRFGRIDVLVNSAAFGYAAFTSHSHPWDEVPLEEWDKVIATDLRGTFLCSSAVLPHMKAQGGGSIINMSSVTNITGGPFLHYTAAKGANEGFTRALARQVGEFGVRVNVIVLGRLFGSQMLQLENHVRGAATALPVQSIKRLGAPEDLWGAVLFLASDDGAFTTGHQIIVDGGRLPSYPTPFSSSH